MNALIAPIESALELTLCGDEGIEFQGQKYVPNATLGYFSFQFSHAFPVSNIYGTAIHPEVVSNSYQTLLRQNLNYEHQIGLYYPDQDVKDRIIGSIAAVDFPRRPAMGWKVQPDPAQSPAITGVASVFKAAAGMAAILGGQLTGRRKYTVSMEVQWPLDESGFAVALNGKESLNPNTPKDILAAGYDYFPYDQSPEMLRSTFSQKKKRIVAQYKGLKVVALMGGLSNPVLYTGAGLVQFGAEPPAKIMRLAASHEPMERLADSLLEVFRGPAQTKC